MLFAKAKTRFVRVSPRKARFLADLVRGLSVEDAFYQLYYSRTKSGKALLKTLKSAVANAETLHNAKREKMKIFEVKVDEGPRWKRAKSRNKGGRSLILKKTTHFNIVLSME